MYSYADRVPPADRWAIAAYIRALQLAQKPVIANLPPDDQASLSSPASDPPPAHRRRRRLADRHGRSCRAGGGRRAHEPAARLSRRLARPHLVAAGRAPGPDGPRGGGHRRDRDHLGLAPAAREPAGAGAADRPGAARSPDDLSVAVRQRIADVVDPRAPLVHAELLFDPRHRLSRHLDRPQPLLRPAGAAGFPSHAGLPRPAPPSLRRARSPPTIGSCRSTSDSCRRPTASW